jgi:hypothetical protein
LGCPAKIIKSEGEREANLREQTIHAGIRKLHTYAFLHNYSFNISKAGKREK